MKQNRVLVVGGALMASWLVYKIYQDMRAQESSLSGDVVNNQKLPRGIRNNNPLNIEFNSNNSWIGQVGSDGRFSKFSESKYGIRAAAKLISNYMSRYKLDTIHKIINRWCPSEEKGNNTTSYVETVSRRTGIGENVKIKRSDIPKIINAMIFVENGQNPYQSQHIVDSCALVDIYGDI